MKHSNSVLCAASLLAVLSASAIADDGKTKALPCTACHGIDGNSTLNPEWPNLAGQHAGYIVNQLQAFKSGARKNPNMNGMAATLSDQDMRDIAAYFSSQSLKIGSTDAAAAAAGAAIYRGGNKASGVPACMACHGPNGAGNPGANYPALRGQHAKYTQIQLQAYKSGERSTNAGEAMRAIAARLTPAEIEQVSLFIRGLH
jgi:cytochrome c553